MNTWTKALIVGAAIVGAQTVAWNVGHADALPLMQHTSGAVFQNARCADFGIWSVDLNVTATNPELHPVVTVQNQASPIVAPAPYRTTFRIPGDQADYKVSISLKWDDSFTQNLGSFTAHRPGDCLLAITTTIAAPTTVVPTTVPTFAPPTTIVPLRPVGPPTVDSTPQITNPVPATSIVQGPPRIVTPLPETGSAVGNVLTAGVIALIVGLGLLWATRRKADG